MHKAKCVKQSDPSGLMFMLGEEYEVSKCNLSALYKYVIVKGLFTNSHDEKHKLKRLISKAICQDHLKITQTE